MRGMTNTNCADCAKQCIECFLGEMDVDERIQMLMDTQNEWLSGTDPREMSRLALSNRMYNTQQIIELLRQMSRCFKPVIAVS